MPTHLLDEVYMYVHLDLDLCAMSLYATREVVYMHEK